MNIKIEKNVVIPASKSTGLTAAIKTLEVGDSFVLPLEKRSNVHTLATNAGFKVVTRLVNETEVRVWRVA